MGAITGMKARSKLEHVDNGRVDGFDFPELGRCR